MSPTKRITLTVSSDVAEALDYLSTRLGIAKSALASQALGETVRPLAALLRSVAPGEAPTAEHIMRMRGASADVIQERLEHLRSVVDSIQSPDNFELDPCDDRPAGCSCDYSTGERLPPRWPVGRCLVHGDGGY